MLRHFVSKAKSLTRGSEEVRGMMETVHLHYM